MATFQYVITNKNTGEVLYSSSSSYRTREQAESHGYAYAEASGYYGDYRLYTSEVPIEDTKKGFSRGDEEDDYYWEKDESRIIVPKTSTIEIGWSHVIGVIVLLIFLYLFNEYIHVDPDAFKKP